MAHFGKFLLKVFSRRGLTIAEVAQIAKVNPRTISRATKSEVPRGHETTITGICRAIQLDHESLMKLWFSEEAGEDWSLREVSRGLETRVANRVPIYSFTAIASRNAANGFPDDPSFAVIAGIPESAFGVYGASPWMLGYPGQVATAICVPMQALAGGRHSFRGGSLCLVWPSSRQAEFCTVSFVEPRAACHPVASGERAFSLPMSDAVAAIFPVLRVVVGYGPDGGDVTIFGA